MTINFCNINVAAVLVECVKDIYLSVQKFSPSNSDDATALSYNNSANCLEVQIMRENERKVVRYFLQEEQKNFEYHYHFLLGWIHHNASDSAGLSTNAFACSALERIRRNDPEKYNQFMSFVLKELRNKLFDNIIPFPDTETECRNVNT